MRRIPPVERDVYFSEERNIGLARERMCFEILTFSKPSSFPTNSLILKVNFLLLSGLFFVLGERNNFYLLVRLKKEGNGKRGRGKGC